ncbi:MAG: DUF6111 family protein [Geminicoccaceae bacterium]
MLRVLLQYLLPLLLPFLVYAAYVALAQGRLPDWLGLSDRQWIVLGSAGVVLLAISLATWSFMTGAPPEETYIPPRFEDGRIIPGTTVVE